jgi:hypothetical protein
MTNTALDTVCTKMKHFFNKFLRTKIFIAAICPVFSDCEGMFRIKFKTACEKNIAALFSTTWEGA